MSLYRLGSNLALAGSGNIPGVSHINKFGANVDIASDTTEDVWDGGGTYSYPTLPLMTKLSQTANQAAMVGAEIEVQGLDANWDLIVQTKALNASNTTTPVTLDTPLLRAFRMKVLANVVGDSPIRLHNDAEDVDYAIISIGNNQTLMALYTVPFGKTAYLTNYYGGLVNTGVATPTNAQFDLWAADRVNNYEFQLKHEVGLPKEGPGFQHDFNPYVVFAEKTDIKISCGVEDKDGHAHAGFDIILIDNSTRATRPGADAVVLTGGAAPIVTVA